MGTGASKKTSNELQGNLDDDDEQLDEEFERQLEKKRREFKIKPGIDPNHDQVQDPANSRTRGRHKVVGEIDSDDEIQNRILQRKESEEIETINNLNRTFASIGLNVDQNHNDHDDAARAHTNNSGSTSSGYVSDNKMYGANSSSSHTRFPPGTSLGRRPSNLQQQQKMRSYKFSWDDQLPNEDSSEDWTYKKTVIEGFDPEKFRKVNKGTKETSFSSMPNTSTTRSENSSIFQSQRLKSGEVRTQMDIPGAVPTYDNTEQKLLASLEQELGVI